MVQGSKACTVRLLNREWAKYVPVYAYEFRDRTAPSYLPTVSYPMGAYHTAELLYLFPLFHGGLGTPHPSTRSRSDCRTGWSITGRPSREMVRQIFQR
jgi:carboxylesterase type B